jgi:hypothetical protein
LLALQHREALILCAVIKDSGLSLGAFPELTHEVSFPEWVIHCEDGKGHQCFTTKTGRAMKKNQIHLGAPGIFFFTMEISMLKVKQYSKNLH